MPSVANAADRYLVSGDNTFTSFGTTDNFIGPTDGGSAVLIWNNGSQVNPYTGNITGNVTLRHTGGNVRMWNATGSTFTGDVYQSRNNLYLATGKELGTGTIYFTGGQLVNEGNALNGTYYRNSVVDNNIVLGGGSVRDMRAGN